MADRVERLPDPAASAQYAADAAANYATLLEATLERRS